MSPSDDLARLLPQLLVLARCPDEGREQRVRFQWTRLELGVELTRQEPRMVRKFDHLDEILVRGKVPR